MKKRQTGKKFGKKLTLNKERVRELSADELKQVQGATGGWCRGNQSGACVSSGCVATALCAVDP